MLVLGFARQNIALRADLMERLFAHGHTGKIRCEIAKLGTKLLALGYEPAQPFFSR